MLPDISYGKLCDSTMEGLTSAVVSSGYVNRKDPALNRSHAVVCTTFAWPVGREREKRLHLIEIVDVIWLAAYLSEAQFQRIVFLPTWIFAALSAWRSRETFLDHLSAMTSLGKSSTTSKAKRKFADISKDPVYSDPPALSSSSSSSSSLSSASDSDSDHESKVSHVPETETVPDEPVLSHAEKRRQKRRKLSSVDVVPTNVPSDSQTKSTSALSKPKKGKKPEGASGGSDALPKRQNSVWVGNLAYKTTAVMLKSFFEGLDVTRIHMPLKAPPSGAGPKVNSG